ncbi:MAG: hypothetical protein WBP64_13270 [Nitrososphaeraceae archaeon]
MLHFIKTLIPEQAGGDWRGFAAHSDSICCAKKREGRGVVSQNI